ncbi:MAG: CsgG/HfaB family protein [Elusimicrobia bacterium]|nr:CsgG/HfaB family protein [Elusimicrobiota bacterium]
MGVFRKSVIAALLAAFAFASPARASEDIKDMAKAVTSAAAARQVKRVAVVPFTAPRGAGSFSGAIVSERLVIQILARGELDLVERRFLDKVLEEQRLGVFGIMDQDTVKALGKVLGVDAILTGTIVELKGERVEINARLIHAETAQVLAADTVRVAKDWEERAIGEDASTWIVPVPDLGDEPFKSGASCQTSVDAVESRLLDFKARYWAERLKDPAFSIRSLRHNPGSEIRNAELKKRFFLKLQERYDAPQRTPLTGEEQAALAKGLQEIKVLSGLCEG